MIYFGRGKDIGHTSIDEIRRAAGAGNFEGDSAGVGGEIAGFAGSFDGWVEGFKDADESCVTTGVEEAGSRPRVVAGGE